MQLNFSQRSALGPLVRRTTLRTLARFTRRVLRTLFQPGEYDWIDGISERLGRASAGLVCDWWDMTWEETEGMRQYRLTGTWRWRVVQHAAAFVEVLSTYVSAAECRKRVREEARDYVVALCTAASCALSEIQVIEIYISTRWPSLADDLRDATTVAVLARRDRHAEYLIALNVAGADAPHSQRFVRSRTRRSSQSISCSRPVRST